MGHGCVQSVMVRWNYDHRSPTFVKSSYLEERFSDLFQDLSLI